jgi:hypothetical protein
MPCMCFDVCVLVGRCMTDDFGVVVLSRVVCTIHGVCPPHCSCGGVDTLVSSSSGLHCLRTSLPNSSIADRVVRRACVSRHARDAVARASSPASVHRPLADAAATAAASSAHWWQPKRRSRAWSCGRRWRIHVPMAVGPPCGACARAHQASQAPHPMHTSDQDSHPLRGRLAHAPYTCATPTPLHLVLRGRLCSLGCHARQQQQPAVVSPAPARCMHSKDLPSIAHRRWLILKRGAATQPLWLLRVLLLPCGAACVRHGTVPACLRVPHHCLEGLPCSR